jgi:hypothetical protein
MKSSISNSNVILSPVMGDDRSKIFLSNLDGRINTEDLHKYFSSFGTIEHIESWTRKSAIILFSNIDSIDCVLSKHRKCIINKQEIYIRRIRYGYIERAYMDSTVLFIKPVINYSSIEWNDSTIRHCFHQYENNIKQIRIVSKYLHAFIHFNDYDIVDKILLRTDKFNINGIDIEMKRAKCNENDLNMENLIEKNQGLKKQIERKRRKFFDYLKNKYVFRFKDKRLNFIMKLNILKIK